MASSSDDYWHSILKKDGITSKGKRVRFHTTPPGKAQLISVGKKRPVDVDTQMVCKSYSKAKKKRRRQKEPAWKDTELKNSEDGLVTTTTTTTAQEYEVEAILDHKKHDDDYLYLLKWKGYSEEENSWEPSSNLSGCGDLLKNYKKRHNLDPPQTLCKEELYQCQFLDGDSRKLVFKKTNQERLDTPQERLGMMGGDEWSVEVNRRMKRLGKLKRKRKSMMVSIKLRNGIQFSDTNNNIPGAEDQADRVTDHHCYSPSLVNDINEAPTTHSSVASLVWHDHMYCKQDTHQPVASPSPARQPHVPMLTPPPSVEPELSSSSSSTFPPSDGIQTSHATTTQPFCVQIQSPPPSPSLDCPIPPGNSHDPLCQSVAPPSPIQVTQPRIHDIDSDSQQSIVAEYPDSPLGHLHLSSTSSASSDVDTCDKEDVDASSLTTKPRNGHNPSEQLKSVLTRTCGMDKKPYPYPRNGSLLSKWHKGPLPLPKSFSMRQSNVSTLSTKAAKLQLPEQIPTLALVSMNEQDNGRSQRMCSKPVMNGLSQLLNNSKPHPKLSLSLKKRPQQLSTNSGLLEHTSAKNAKKARKVLARSTSENSKHLVVVSSPVAATPSACKGPSPKSAHSVTSKCGHDSSDKAFNHSGGWKSTCVNGKSGFNHIDKSRSSGKQKSGHCDKPKPSHDDGTRSDNDAESSASSGASDQMSKYAYKEILMNWQYELNKQRAGTDDIIYVENDVDMELPPSDFIYTSSNIYSSGIPNPSSDDIVSSLCGCECYYLGRKCGPRSEYCCASMAGSKFAYTVAGKVRVQPGTPIYECNLKCSCPSDCTNRVVQLGRKIPLCIFRTANRGWGVKTIEPIKPNTFITEYVGEVISNEEAEKRGKKCDARGITYLFDLDFEDDNSAFTIDAARYGNISHFFNHSCDPNLVVYSVWIDTLDKRLPRLAFFTTRSISIGEELTFDYQMNKNCDHSAGCGPKMPCLCGSKNCLGFMY